MHPARLRMCPWQNRGAQITEGLIEPAEEFVLYLVRRQHGGDIDAY